MSTLYPAAGLGAVRNLPLHFVVRRPGGGRSLSATANLRRMVGAGGGCPTLRESVAQGTYCKAVGKPTAGQIYCAPDGFFGKGSVVVCVWGPSGLSNPDMGDSPEPFLRGRVFSLAKTRHRLCRWCVCVPLALLPVRKQLVKK